MKGNDRVTDTRQSWMRAQLNDAARLFDADLVGDPIHGVRGRTIGGRAVTPAGERWIRVLAVPDKQAGGPLWEGPIAAATIKGVQRPSLIAHKQWGDPAARQCLRAEQWTLAPGPVCSTIEALTEELDLPAEWWSGLTRSLAALAAHPTDRIPRTQQQISRVLADWYGPAVDPTVTTWMTAHGDLRWTNLTRTGPYVLDCTLLCTSLLAPRIFCLVKSEIDAESRLLVAGARREGEGVSRHAAVWAP
jgi:hypothetical protein